MHGWRKFFVVSLAAIIGIGTIGCSSVKLKLAEGDALDSSYAYLSARDSGGIAPIWVPISIEVDGIVLVRADRLPNDVLYKVKPGKHTVVVRYREGPGTWLFVAGVGDSWFSKTFELQPGIPYVAISRAIPSSQGSARFDGYIGEYKQEYIDNLRKR